MQTASAITIVSITAADQCDWRRLWDGNNGGAIDERITAQTWARLLDERSTVNGLLARAGDDVCGLVHFILHPVTGNLNPACYMQDLYVDPAFRRRGVARALIGQLAALGRMAGWARLYWLAETANPEAQALYRRLGVRLDFTFHVMPLHI
jgi:ribosomal protein S18 acetylase RimI-like enzyme